VNGFAGFFDRLEQKAKPDRGGWDRTRQREVLGKKFNGILGDIGTDVDSGNRHGRLNLGLFELAAPG